MGVLAELKKTRKKLETAKIVLKLFRQGPLAKGSDNKSNTKEYLEALREAMSLGVCFDVVFLERAVLLQVALALDKGQCRLAASVLAATEVVADAAASGAALQQQQSEALAKPAAQVAVDANGAALQQQQSQSQEALARLAADANGGALQGQPALNGAASQEALAKPATTQVAVDANGAAQQQQQQQFQSEEPLAKPATHVAVDANGAALQQQQSQSQQALVAKVAGQQPVAEEAGPEVDPPAAVNLFKELPFPSSEAKLESQDHLLTFAVLRLLRSSSDLVGISDFAAAVVEMGDEAFPADAARHIKILHLLLDTRPGLPPWLPQ